MAKQLQFNEEARKSLVAGVEKISRAVMATLGPKGRLVVIDKKFGAPTVTKDGVSVAREVELENPFENMGAQLLKEVATKTNDVAGDGTTTATVLAWSITKEGMKSVAAGVNPMGIRRGIDKAVIDAVSEIKKQAKMIKDKEEIYYYAVKLVTGRMFAKYATLAWSSEDNYMNRIKRICSEIMDTATAHEGELTSLVDVMLQMKKEGRDFNEIVMRRTAKLTILFKRLLRVGISCGDIIECDINKVANHILLLLESSCFQVAFLDTFEMALSKELIANYLEFFKARPKTTPVISRS